MFPPQSKVYRGDNTNQIPSDPSVASTGSKSVMMFATCASHAAGLDYPTTQKLEPPLTSHSAWLPENIWTDPFGAWARSCLSRPPASVIQASPTSGESEISQHPSCKHYLACCLLHFLGNVLDHDRLQVARCAPHLVKSNQQMSPCQPCASEAPLALSSG